MSLLPDSSFLAGIAQAVSDRLGAAAFVLRIDPERTEELSSVRGERGWSAHADAALRARIAAGPAPLTPELVVGDPTIAFALIPGGEPVALCVLFAKGRVPTAAQLRLLGQFAGVAAKRMGIASPPPGTPARSTTSSLQSRYQQLLLLNRISLGLFSGSTLESSLESAAHGILALTGGKFLALLRKDESDALEPFFQLGNPRYLEQGADSGLNEALSRLRLDPAPVWLSGTPVGWYARPIAARHARRMDGVLAVGFLSSERPGLDVENLLADVCSLLYNAFRVERQLREQETLAAVTEQSADPILMTDLQGRITAWSRGAVETFGYTAEEVMRRNRMELLVPPEDAEETEALELRTRSEGQVLGVEVTRLHRDGRRIEVEATYTVVKDDAGRPFGVVRVLRDITRRKELERMREEFIAMVTHDLRIPLTSIRGFSEAMGDFWSEMPDEEKKKYVAVILRESKRMSRLVDDFLDLSRFEGDSVELDKAPVDLPALMDRVVETLKGYGPGIAFEVRGAADAPPLLAETHQLERVLINLGGNAVKYSPEGGTVLFSIEPDGAQGLLFTVRDEGPGIPKEAQTRLFEKFYRVSDEISKRKKGSGLGLTVCKLIVEAHGGTIWVDSEPGKGTAFRFRLPAGIPAASK